MSKSYAKESIKNGPNPCRWSDEIVQANRASWKSIDLAKRFLSALRRKHIYIKDIAGMSYEFPIIAEQWKIASFIPKFDEKIELE
jgi:hypothetical protein